MGKGGNKVGIAKTMGFSQGPMEIQYNRHFLKYIHV